MFCIFRDCKSVWKHQGKEATRWLCPNRQRDVTSAFPCTVEFIILYECNTTSIYNNCLPVLIGCSGTDNKKKKPRLTLCPRHVWLFLHQGQQHLPARLHRSHGNTSKQQPDRQKQEMQRGKNKAVILFTLSHNSFPSSQSRSPKWNTVCRCCFQEVKTPGTRASHSGGTNCPLRMSFSTPSVHILTIWRYSSMSSR